MYSPSQSCKIAESGATALADALRVNKSYYPIQSQETKYKQHMYSKCSSNSLSIAMVITLLIDESPY